MPSSYEKVIEKDLLPNPTIANCSCWRRSFEQHTATQCFTWIIMAFKSLFIDVSGVHSKGTISKIRHHLICIKSLNPTGVVPAVDDCALFLRHTTWLWSVCGWSCDGDGGGGCCEEGLCCCGPVRLVMAGAGWVGEKHWGSAGDYGPAVRMKSNCWRLPCLQFHLGLP